MGLKHCIFQMLCFLCSASLFAVSHYGSLNTNHEAIDTSPQLNCSELTCSLTNGHYSSHRVMNTGETTDEHDNTEKIQRMRSFINSGSNIGKTMVLKLGITRCGPCLVFTQKDKNGKSLLDAIESNSSAALVSHLNLDRDGGMAYLSELNDLLPNQQKIPTPRLLPTFIVMKIGSDGKLKLLGHDHFGSLSERYPFNGNRSNPKERYTHYVESYINAISPQQNQSIMRSRPLPMKQPTESGDRSKDTGRF